VKTLSLFKYRKKQLFWIIIFHLLVFSDKASFHFEFDIPTAVTMNSTIFWDVTPCSLVEFNQCLGGTYCLYLQDRRVSQENEPVRSMDQSCCYFTVWSCQSPAQSPNWENTPCRLSATAYLMFSVIRHNRKPLVRIMTENSNVYTHIYFVLHMMTAPSRNDINTP
jgi:hypothetical protein